MGTELSPESLSLLRIADLFQYFEYWDSDITEEDPDGDGYYWLTVMFKPKATNLPGLYLIRPAMFRGIIQLKNEEGVWRVAEVLNAGTPRQGSSSGLGVVIFKVDQKSMTSKLAAGMMVLTEKSGKEYVFGRSWK